MSTAKFKEGACVHCVGKGYPKLQEQDYAPRFQIMEVKKIDGTWQYSIVDDKNQNIWYSEDQLGCITPDFKIGQTVVWTGSSSTQEEKECVVQDIRLSKTGDCYEIKLGDSDTSWYSEDKFILAAPSRRLQF